MQIYQDAIEAQTSTVISTFVVASTFRDVIENCNGTVYLVQTTHASGNSFRTYIPPVCLVVSTRWRDSGGCFMEVPGTKMWLIHQKETSGDVPRRTINGQCGEV